MLLRHALRDLNGEKSRIFFKLNEEKRITSQMIRTTFFPLHEERNIGWKWIERNFVYLTPTPKNHSPFNYGTPLGGGGVPAADIDKVSRKQRCSTLMLPPSQWIFHTLPTWAPLPRDLSSRRIIQFPFNHRQSPKCDKNAHSRFSFDGRSRIRIYFFLFLSTIQSRQ